MKKGFVIVGLVLTLILFGFVTSEENATTSSHASELMRLKSSVSSLFTDEETPVDDYMEIFPYNHDNGEKHFIVLYYRCMKNGESKAYSLESYESATPKWYDYLEKIESEKDVSPNEILAFNFQKFGSTVTVSLEEKET